MTWREACARCQLVNAPEASISALLEVKAALDALPVAGRCSTIPSQKNPKGKEAGEDGATERERQIESTPTRASVGGTNR
ncbi:MAG TPA: hypothetical protein VGI36_03935, partial [Candidatus Binataceae bacterium]